MLKKISLNMNTSTAIHTPSNVKPEFSAGTLQLVLKSSNDILKETKVCFNPILHLTKWIQWWLAGSRTMEYVASITRHQECRGVRMATFYTMFNTQPVGKYMLGLPYRTVHDQWCR